MSNIRNIIIYIVVGIIIFISFKLPEILFELTSDNFEVAVYRKDNESSKIDVDADTIYLVKVIHDIEGGINTVVITSNDSSKKIKLSEYTELKSDILDSLQKELLKLKEYNILGNENITIDSDTEISMIDKIYKSGNTEYTIKRVSLKKDKEYNLEREEKTGKILYMFLDKDDIYIKDKQELLKKYVNYLDLYIIDDWKFENKMIKNEKSKYFLEFECNTLKSEKAGLTAYLIENENNYILSVHSSNGFSNVVEYYSE